jgi:hypothetical protein
MERCANTEALNAYMRQIDNEERKADAIDTRTAELFADEYRHDTFAAIVEALDETAGENADAIEAAAKKADMAALGRAVLQASAAYWESMARKKAADDINDSWCHACQGRGCRNCNDDQPRSDE